MRSIIVVVTVFASVFAACGEGDPTPREVADGATQVDVSSDADAASEVVPDSVGEADAADDIDAMDDADETDDSVAETTDDTDDPDTVADTADVLMDTAGTAADSGETLEDVVDTQDAPPDTDPGSPREVSGTLGSDTWSGEIIVTSPLTLRANETLTILPGTVITASGDFDIEVQGKVIAVGTAAQPITITGFGFDVRAAGSTLEHVSIRDSAVSIRTDEALTLRDVTIDNVDTGIHTGRGARLTGERVTLTDVAGDAIEVVDVSAIAMTDLTISGSGGSGVYLASRLPSSIIGCHISDNALHGIHVERGAPTLSDCTIEQNGKNGVLFEGSGSLKRSTLRGNGHEGVLVWTDSSPTISRCNIFGNATVGAYVVAHVSLRAATTAEGTGEVVSDTFSTPHGEDIAHVLVSAADVGSQPWTTAGFIERGDGAPYIDLDDSLTREWLNVIPEGSSVRVRVTDDSPTQRTSMRIDAVTYFELGAKRELTVITDYAVSATKLYLGRFPDIDAVVSSGSDLGLDLDGFVGAPLDATFSNTAPYYGADAFANGLAWSGEVFVTGKLSVTGGTFDVAPGTNVQVVRVNLPGVNAAQLNISNDTTLAWRGTAAAPVRIAAYGPGTARPLGLVSLYRVHGAIRHLELSDGDSLLVRASDVVLEDVTVQHMDEACAQVERITWTRGVVADCGGSAAVVLGDRAVLDGLDISGAAIGVSLDTYSGIPSTLRNSIVHDNAVGVAAQDGDLVAEHNRITNNGVGLELFGDAGGTVSANDIVDNDREGLLVHPGLFGGAANRFTVTVSGNNVYDNARAETPVLAAAGLSLATDGSVGERSTAPFVTPAGAPIAFTVTTFTRSTFDTSAFVETADGARSQFLLDDPRHQVFDVRTWSSDSARLRMTTSSADVDSIAALTHVLYHVPSDGAAVELVALVGGDPIDLSGNYWGVADPSAVARIAVPGSVALDAAAVPFEDAGPMP